MCSRSVSPRVTRGGARQCGPPVPFSADRLVVLPSLSLTVSFSGLFGADHLPLWGVGVRRNKWLLHRLLIGWWGRR